MPRQLWIDFRTRAHDAALTNCVVVVSYWMIVLIRCALLVNRMPLLSEIACSRCSIIRLMERARVVRVNENCVQWKVDRKGYLWFLKKQWKPCETLQTLNWFTLKIFSAFRDASPMFDRSRSIGFSCCVEMWAAEMPKRFANPFTVLPTSDCAYFFIFPVLFCAFFS